MIKLICADSRFYSAMVMSLNPAFLLSTFDCAALKQTVGRITSEPWLWNRPTAHQHLLPGTPVLAMADAAWSWVEKMLQLDHWTCRRQTSRRKEWDHV